MVTKKEYTEEEWIQEGLNINNGMYIEEEKEEFETPFIHWEQSLKSVNKTDLFNKFEMVIHTNDRKIIYDDITNSIIYYDNGGNCITVDLKNTLSLAETYKKMQEICIILINTKEK
jgi:hypothetical protein